MVREHTPPIAKQLNLVVFSDLYFWFLVKIMFKVFHHMLPKCTVSMFTRLSNVVNVNIRQVNYNFYLPKVRLNVSKKFVTFSGELCWSKLSHTAKSSITLYTFKCSVYMELSSQYYYYFLILVEYVVILFFFVFCFFLVLSMLVFTCYFLYLLKL